MWEALAKMSAWRFILLLVTILFLALLIATLIDAKDLSEQTINQIVTAIVSGATGGIGGFAAGAKVRSTKKKKIWDGKERRSHAHVH